MCGRRAAFVIAQSGGDDNERARPRRPVPAGPRRPRRVEPAQAQAFRINVKGGVVDGDTQTIKVKKGDRVQIVVSSDAPDQDSPPRLRHREGGQPGKPARSSSRGRRGRLRLESHTAEDAGHEPAGGGAHGRAVVTCSPTRLVLGRADLPIPEWLFGWAAAMVLFVSFVGARGAVAGAEAAARTLAAAPGGVGRLLASRPVEIVCGADRRVPARRRRLHAASRARRAPTANFAPTFVYVIFWVGLVPLSVLFGDVFRAFNPWRAIGAGGRVGWRRRAAGAASCRRRCEYPERLGRWPAAAGIFAVRVARAGRVASGDEPGARRDRDARSTRRSRSSAMALYGVEAWMRRGEAFSVYFNLFSRMSPLRDARRRARACGGRCPGSPQLEPGRARSALLAVMIGTVTLRRRRRGADRGRASRRTCRDFFQRRGLSPRARARAGVPGRADRARSRSSPASTGSGSSGRAAWAAASATERLARAFVHSLVPIALVYVVAHYLTYLLFHGQAIVLPGVRPARPRLGPVRHRRRSRSTTA